MKSCQIMSRLCSRPSSIFSPHSGERPTTAVPAHSLACSYLGAFAPAVLLSTVFFLQEPHGSLPHSPLKIVVLSENSLGLLAKSPAHLQTSYFLPLLYFSSLAFSVIHLTHHLATKFLGEHTHTLYQNTARIC